MRSFSVAVGRPGTETPTGRFAVTDKLRPGDPASPYGCCLLALSGHQTKLIAGWPGGDRLAIHATPSLWTVGKAASLGCMRARPGDIRRLMRKRAGGHAGVHPRLRRGRAAGGASTRSRPFCLAL